MTADPRSMRASDQDRDRAASLLREHHAVGRLTPEEFSDRLDKVFAARTIGDLDDLLDDLPGIDLYRLPDAAVRRRGPVPGGTSYLSALQAQGRLPHLRIRGGVWGSWLSLSLLCFVIWAISGGGYLWPLWVAGPLGVVLLGARLTGGSGPGGHGGNRELGQDREHGEDRDGEDRHGHDRHGHDHHGHDRDRRARDRESRRRRHDDQDQIGGDAPGP
jgi:hypothetical protein